MASRVWSAWYDAVAPHVPGAPLALISYEVRRAAIEFCRESHGWRMALAPIDSIPLTGDYVLPDAAAGISVERVLECRWQGTKIYAKRPDELEAIYSPNDWRAQTGTPRYFTAEASNILKLVPAPDTLVVGGINGLFAAVAPRDDATGIDDAFASDWFQDIADGAKRNIMLIPKMPYSNGQLAQVYDATFRAGIGNAGYVAFRGNSPTASRTQTQFR